MKTIFLTFIFLFIAVSNFAQKQIINLGAGFPISFKADFTEGTDIHQLTRERVYLFAEVPVFMSPLRKLSIRPGIGYFLFNEIQASSPWALGGHSEKYLTHNAISLQTRFLYHFTSDFKKSGSWYSGGVFGVYLWSKTTGESSWYFHSGNGYTSGQDTYNLSGKGFFHAVYAGITAGYQFKTSSGSNLYPSLECSFFPLFATVNDKNRQIGMIIIVLGFGQKKATRENE